MSSRKSNKQFKKETFNITRDEYKVLGKYIGANKKLNLKHRTIMALLYNKVKHLPENKKTAEIKAMIEPYNQKVYFIDYDALNQIIKVINQ